MTLTITAPRALLDLQPGDRIVAIDDHLLPQPREVLVPRAVVGPNRVEAITLVNALGTDTEWNLYPDAFEVLTIERGPVVEPTSVEIRPEERLALTIPRPPQRPRTARETGTVEPMTPLTAALQDKARRHTWNGGTTQEWDDRARKVLRRTPSYVRMLRLLADQPNGLYTMTGDVDAVRRSEGTVCGFMANYGWCYQIGTNPARWQITQAGLDVILAWDAEHPESR